MDWHQTDGWMDGRHDLGSFSARVKLFDTDIGWPIWLVLRCDWFLAKVKETTC